MVSPRARGELKGLEKEFLVRFPIDICWAIRSIIEYV